MKKVIVKMLLLAAVMATCVGAKAQAWGCGMLWNGTNFQIRSTSGLNTYSTYTCNYAVVEYWNGSSWALFDYITWVPGTPPADRADNGYSGNPWALSTQWRITVDDGNTCGFASTKYITGSSTPPNVWFYGI